MKLCAIFDVSLPLYHLVGWVMYISFSPVTYQVVCHVFKRKSNKDLMVLNWIQIDFHDSLWYNFDCDNSDLMFLFYVSMEANALHNVDNLYLASNIIESNNGTSWILYILVITVAKLKISWKWHRAFHFRHFLWVEENNSEVLIFDFHYKILSHYEIQLHRKTEQLCLCLPK